MDGQAKESGLEELDRWALGAIIGFCNRQWWDYYPWNCLLICLAERLIAYPALRILFHACIRIWVLENLLSVNNESLFQRVAMWKWKVTLRQPSVPISEGLNILAKVNAFIICNTVALTSVSEKHATSEIIFV